MRGRTLGKDYGEVLEGIRLRLRGGWILEDGQGPVLSWTVRLEPSPLDDDCPLEEEERILSDPDGRRQDDRFLDTASRMRAEMARNLRGGGPGHRRLRALLRGCRAAGWDPARHGAWHLWLAARLARIISAR